MKQFQVLLALLSNILSFKLHFLASLILFDINTLNAKAATETQRLF